MDEDGYPDSYAHFAVDDSQAVDFRRSVAHQAEDLGMSARELRVGYGPVVAALGCRVLGP